MKVVIFPGVNFKMAGSHKYFLKKITDGLGCTGEIFVWENPHVLPPFNLPLQDTRNILCGVLLDFERVLLHSQEIKVPDADVYIGHSAGSIMALIQDRPCVTMASPAALVDTLIQEENSAPAKDPEVALAAARVLKALSTHQVLNVINRYDLVAYPFIKPNIENYEYTGTWCNPNSYNPLVTHSDYWTNKTVIDKVITTIKSWNKA